MNNFIIVHVQIRRLAKPTVTYMVFYKIPQRRENKSFISLTSISCFYQESSLEASRLIPRLEQDKGKHTALRSAVIPLLPEDILDRYSKYTLFQSMSPPGLEAMVSRRGDKANACGAWLQSGQINKCPFYSQREKNGAIQEQTHLSLGGFTWVSEKPHSQQSLSSGTQASCRSSTFVHW